MGVSPGGGLDVGNFPNSMLPSYRLDSSTLKNLAL